MDWREDEYIRNNEISADEDPPGEAADPPVPPGVIQMDPYIDPTLWRWQTPMHLRAPHPRGGHVLVVVGAGGGLDAVGGYAATPRAERAEYAKLHEVRARVVAHREACEQGTPSVHDDGRCVWCGKQADQHAAPDPESTEPPATRPPESDLEAEVNRLRIELLLARDEAQVARDDVAELRRQAASALVPIGTAVESLRRRLAKVAEEDTHGR